MVSDAFTGCRIPEINLDATPAAWPPWLLPEARIALQTPAEPDPVALVSAMGAPQPENDYDVRAGSRAGPRRSCPPAVAERPRGQAPPFPAARFRALTQWAIGFCATPILRHSATCRRKRASDSAACCSSPRISRHPARWNGSRVTILWWYRFGMEPFSPASACSRSWPAIHWQKYARTRPDGFVLAFGAPVAPGPPARQWSTWPRRFYFLGLPVARDMDGLREVIYSRRRSRVINPFCGLERISRRMAGVAGGALYNANPSRCSR